MSNRGARRSTLSPTGPSIKPRNGLADPPVEHQHRHHHHHGNDYDENVTAYYFSDSNDTTSGIVYSRGITYELSHMHSGGSYSTQTSSSSNSNGGPEIEFQTTPLRPSKSDHASSMTNNDIKPQDKSKSILERLSNFLVKLYDPHQSKPKPHQHRQHHDLESTKPTSLLFPEITINSKDISDTINTPSQLQVAKSHNHELISQILHQETLLRAELQKSKVDNNNLSTTPQYPETKFRSLGIRSAKTALKAHHRPPKPPSTRTNMTNNTTAEKNDNRMHAIEMSFLSSSDFLASSTTTSISPTILAAMSSSAVSVRPQKSLPISSPTSLTPFGSNMITPNTLFNPCQSNSLHAACPPTNHMPQQPNQRRHSAPILTSNTNPQLSSTTPKPTPKKPSSSSTSPSSNCLSSTTQTTTKNKTPPKPPNPCLHDPHPEKDRESPSQTSPLDPRQKKASRRGRRKLSASFANPNLKPILEKDNSRELDSKAAVTQVE
jgi:hypothetical protein